MSKVMASAAPRGCYIALIRFPAPLDEAINEWYAGAGPVRGNRWVANSKRSRVAKMHSIIALS